MIGLERVWKFPEQPPHPLALSVERTSWITDKRDLERVKVLNFVFQRILIAIYRHYAYSALTIDQELLKRTDEPHYQAPLNLIRASLATNIRIAVCSLHDKSKDCFSITKTTDEMFKDGFEKRSIAHYEGKSKDFDVLKEFEALRAAKKVFSIPQALEDLKKLKTLRDSALAHIGIRSMEDPPLADWGGLTDRTFGASLNLLFIIRRTFVGHYGRN